MDKVKKRFLFLTIIILIGFITGIIFSNILNTNDEKLVYIKLTDYFNNLKNDLPINYWNNFFMIVKNNYFYLIIIWILGLSIIGLLLNNFILFFKSFILGFSVGSIINIYLYRGIILAIVYVFPTLIINIIIYLIMVYYANNISLKLFDILFLKKDIKFNILIKKYCKLLGIFLLIMLFTSILETLLNPFLMKLFLFLI